MDVRPRLFLCTPSVSGPWDGPDNESSPFPSIWNGMEETKVSLMSYYTFTSLQISTDLIGYLLSLQFQEQADTVTCWISLVCTNTEVRTYIIILFTISSTVNYEFQLFVETQTLIRCLANRSNMTCIICNTDVPEILSLSVMCTK
jgi:hypothetical protein